MSDEDPQSEGSAATASTSNVSALADVFERSARQIRDLINNPDLDDNAFEYIEEWLDELVEDATLAKARVARRNIASRRCIEVGAVVARAVKGLREATGWTQEELAEAMRRIGFTNWKRITVAEAESGKRKMQIEELLGYAVLFGTSLAAILEGLYPEEALVLNDALILSDTEAAQLVAQDVVLYAGPNASATAEVPAKLAGVEDPSGYDDWRPVANARSSKDMQHGTLSGVLSPGGLAALGDDARGVAAALENLEPADLKGIQLLAHSAAQWAPKGFGDGEKRITHLQWAIKTAENWRSHGHPVTPDRVAWLHRRFMESLASETDQGDLEEQIEGWLQEAAEQDQ